MTAKADKLVTVEAARQALQDAVTTRAVACQAEINAALEKYQCELYGQPIIAADGTLRANVILRPAGQKGSQACQT